MAGFTDFLELELLDHIFTDAAYTPPATLHIALSTTTPTDAGTNFTEPGVGAYARVSTAAADWNVATGTAPVTKDNSAVKTFPQATANWGTITHFGIFDAATLGNLLAFGALGTSKAVNNGDTASFAAGALVIKLGDPGDTF